MDSLSNGASGSELTTRRRLLLRAGSLGVAAAAAPVAENLLNPSIAFADVLPTPISPEPAFAGGVAISDAGPAAAQHWFTLGPRQSTVLNFAVPSLRPVSSNQGIALDVMPNGTAPNNPGNGLTWFDVCDSDVYAGGGAVGTARVGIFPDHVEFGSRGFGVAGKPVWISANGNGSTPPQVELVAGSPGSVTLGADGSNIIMAQSVAVGGPALAQTALTVRGRNTPVFMSVNHADPGATSGAGIVGRAYASATAPGQRLGYFLFGGDQAAANTAGMSGWSAEMWQAGTSLGTYLTFDTTPTKSTARRERLRIGSDGVFRIPSADAPPVALPPVGTGYLFVIDGALMWQGASGKVTTLAPG